MPGLTLHWRKPKRECFFTQCLTCLSLVSTQMPMCWGNRDERVRFCPQSHSREKQRHQQLQNSVLATVLEVCTGAVGAPRRDSWLHGSVGGRNELRRILAKEPLAWHLKAWLPTLEGCRYRCAHIHLNKVPLLGVPLFPNSVIKIS